MPTNSAAWILEPRGYPLVVKDAPYPTAEPGEIIVKNHALGVNPADYKIQDTDMFQSKYPDIQGYEVAGEVVAVGNNVDGISVGQRVTGFAPSAVTGNTKHSGFQQYTVLIPALTTPIPNSLSYEEAVVLPVGIATASAGLFQSDFLSLPLPTLSPKQTNSVILIWGGSSAIGCSGIQLARAAGLQVITTASKHNFQLCKDLGAAEVFGRASPSITNEILEYLEGKDFLGVYDAIGLPDTLEACVEIMAKRKPGGIIASTLPPMVAIDAKGIQIKMVHCLKIIDNVAPAIFNDYLPKALEQGKFLAKPDPLVVGTGLEFVQKGMDRVKEGYSARKVVVKL